MKRRRLVFYADREILFWIPRFIRWRNGWSLHWLWWELASLA